MRYIYIKIFIIIVFLFPCHSFAEITFTNGKWESTFDCAEYISFSGTMDCDGMADSGGPWTVDGNQTTITSAANNPDGGGGRGARFWKGDGENICSSTIAVTFPSDQPEIWVRWYERYQSGFEWGATYDVKSLYFKNAQSYPYVGYKADGYRFYFGGSAAGPWPGYGDFAGLWTDVYPTGTADGTWHCFEVYMKAETDGQSDGVGRIWIDGELIAEETAMDWGSSGFDGWTYFDFLSNQKYPSNGQAMYVDVDDMVVYNTTPPNTDGSGNPYIGPLGESPPAFGAKSTIGSATNAPAFDTATNAPAVE